MNRFPKIMTSVAAVAMLASTAAPAEAQRRWHRDRDRGIDAGDVIAGVAIIGGIAAIASALSRDNDRNGRYRGAYERAVNSCGYEAERYGRGRVEVTNVDRVGGDRYRVEGVIRGGYDRYDRYDDRRDDRYYDDGRYGYDRYDRDGFYCVARGNGRIVDFRTSDRYSYR